jgi:hypothetical protein
MDMSMSKKWLINQLDPFEKPCVCSSEMNQYFQMYNLLPIHLGESITYT